MDWVGEIVVVLAVAAAAGAAFVAAYRSAARSADRPPSLFARMREHVAFGGGAATGRASGGAEVADAIERCGRCAHPAECLEWLGSDQGREPPPFCANAKLLRQEKSAASTRSVR
jgi:hypothetical protein